MTSEQFGGRAGIRELGDLPGGGNILNWQGCMRQCGVFGKLQVVQIAVMWGDKAGARPWRTLCGF